MSAGRAMSAARYDVVIPTIGRPSLERLLAELEAAPDPARGRVIVVDDRAEVDGGGLVSGSRSALAGRAVEVVRAGGRGPAAARNRGWRASTAPWVVFLDDDVLPGTFWRELLAADLDAAEVEADVGGVQGRIRVPLPSDRRPTDWERNVAGLEEARWATADLAYRRAALEQVGGFDERFRRNYREDADLGLRVVAAGWRIERGRREIVHPVGPAGRWTSVKLQRGNGDDVLMRRLHGRDWRERAAAPPGRLPRHALTAGAGVAAVGLGVGAVVAGAVSGGAAARRGAGARRGLALGAGAAGGRHGVGGATRRGLALGAGAAAATWAAGTAELTWARIAPGPRTREEIATMAATSLAMPFAALWHRLRGELRQRAAEPHECGSVHARDAQIRTHPPEPARAAPLAVLFDRDGTLIEDVPYNGDPSRVELRPGAFDAVASLRDAGLLTAIVSNQSGIARGLLTHEQVEAVNDCADRMLGGVGPWLFCPHGPHDGCDCRKPAPGLVLAAARELGVAPERCVVIGDIGADVEAARAAGARGVLVPTAVTRREEVERAEEVAPDLLSAVRRVLATREAER